MLVSENMTFYQLNDLSDFLLKRNCHKNLSRVSFLVTELISLNFLWALLTVGFIGYHENITYGVLLEEGAFAK
jgi:hypothetical protein